jgi:hypothetical protein
MDAQIVERATLTPAQCMFSGTGNGPMVDFQREFTFDHAGRIYMSIQVCKEIGAIVGLVEPEQATDEQTQEMRESLAALEAEVLELRKFKESAKYTIESLGATVRNKPGRPKKELASAVSS